MSDQNPPPPRPRLPALLIPADPSQSVKIIDLNNARSHLDALQAAVNGTVEVQAHDEGDLWLNDVGRLIDLPINVRVNHWMINNSHLAHHHRVSEWMMIYGDAVMTGPPDRNGNETPVSQHLINHFQNLSLAPDALKDWDIRSTTVRIIHLANDGPSGPEMRPGGFGLDI